MIAFGMLSLSINPITSSARLSNVSFSLFDYDRAAPVGVYSDTPIRGYF